MQATRKYMLPKDFLEVNWKETDKSKFYQLFEPVPNTIEG